MRYVAHSLSLFFCVLMMLQITASQAQEDNSSLWFTDSDSAKKNAKLTNRHIVALFTAKDNSDAQQVEQMLHTTRAKAAILGKAVLLRISLDTNDASATNWKEVIPGQIIHYNLEGTLISAWAPKTDMISLYDFLEDLPLQPNSTNPISPNARLQISGPKFVTNQHQVILLRGFNWAEPGFCDESDMALFLERCL